MSCKDCDEAQEKKGPAYLRWGTANIEINGCDAHVAQVMDTLNHVQTVVSDLTPDIPISAHPLWEDVELHQPVSIKKEDSNA